MLTNLRKVGGSIMLAVSPVFLEELGVGPGSAVDVALLEGQLIVKPIGKPQYKLVDLLAQCDGNAKITKEDKEWLNATPVGRELL